MQKAKMSWLWIAALAALSVGCSDNGYTPVHHAPPITVLNEDTENEPLPKGAMIEVNRLTDKDGNERYWSLDPRVPEVFGWPSQIYHVGDQEVLGSTCDLEDLCFSGAEQVRDLLEGKDIVQVVGDTRWVIRSTKVADGKVFGTSRQALCSGGSSVCPGPWTAAVGGLVPDNFRHINVWSPFFGTAAGTRINRVLAANAWFTGHNYRLPDLGIAEAPWTHQRLPVVGPTGSATLDTGWTFNTEVNLEYCDSEQSDVCDLVGYWIGQRRIIPLAEAIDGTYINGDFTADVLWNEGRLNTLETTQAKNCPIFDEWISFLPLGGCTNTWLIPALVIKPDGFRKPATTANCFWEKAGTTKPCPYARIAGSVVTLDVRELDARAATYGLNAEMNLYHATNHEYGHSMGLTHFNNCGPVGGQPCPPDGSSCMHRQATTPGAVAMTISTGELCELKGAGRNMGHTWNGSACGVGSASDTEQSGYRLIGSTEY